MKKYEKEMALFRENIQDFEEKKVMKEKAKYWKINQKKNNIKACNCGNCDECKKSNKKK